MKKRGERVGKERRKRGEREEKEQEEEEEEEEREGKIKEGGAKSITGFCPSGRRWITFRIDSREEMGGSGRECGVDVVAQIDEAGEETVLWCLRHCHGNHFHHAPLGKEAGPTG